MDGKLYLVDGESEVFVGDVADMEIKLMPNSKLVSVFDASAFSLAEWARFVGISSHEAMRQVDEFKARLSSLNAASKKCSFHFAAFHAALIGNDKRTPGRSKPARRAMAKLAARRGRRG